MQTSDRGIAYIERVEGVVLKAYRDPVGFWTIGGGLTAASGVIVPKAGMVITREEATRLMKLALTRSYEPAVAAAMPHAEQHEFDGGVSFHWNTGAIGRASWVAAWRAGDWSAVASKIMLWTKGGGKVLPGLVRRRQEELKIIRYGIYPGVTSVPVTPVGIARWAVPVVDAEIAAIRAGFRKLGYDPGNDGTGVMSVSVMKFQRDHDLTVDGIIGRATLSTLQRRLDATRKTTQAAAGGATGAAATEGLSSATDVTPDWLVWVVAALTVLLLARLAWSYRDVIAAKVQSVTPGLARFLRRF